MVALASYLSGPLGRKHLPPELPAAGPGIWLVKFRDDLKGQTHDSIDRFIQDNPQHRFMGKLLIARHVLLGMYDYYEREDRWKLKPFSARQAFDGSVGRRNWYHQLINLIREGAQSAADLRLNRIDVVTFNYDLSLECALEDRFANTEAHAGANWQDIVSISHVNGAPQKVPRELFDVGLFLIETAATIRLVERDDCSVLAKVRDRAREAVQASDQVFAIGFHFDNANVTTIGLQDRRSMKGVFAISHDGHLGLAMRMRDLGIPDVNVRSGTRTEVMHIDAALDEGFLEQASASNIGTVRTRRPKKRA
jgi:hypothetical protein